MSSRDKGNEPSQRQLKVGELIRHALAEIFSRGEISDEVLERHSLTVPEVRMSPDLKLATVYVLPLGGGEAEEAVAHLDKHKRYLRWAASQARQHEVHAGAQVQGGYLVRGFGTHRRVAGLAQGRTRPRLLGADTYRWRDAKAYPSTAG
jgi:ribosome-binding factor A